MKRGLLSIVCLVVLSAAAIPVDAQTRSRWVNNNRAARRYDQRVTRVNNNYGYRDSRYRNNAYGNSGYGYDGYNGSYNNRYYDNRSTWDRSRDKITTAIGAGAGAGVGALVGGRKGAIIGALAGGGGAALYTYVLRDKGHRRRY
jgi:hypothetical protein